MWGPAPEAPRSLHQCASPPQAGLGKGEDEDEAVDKPPASSRGAHGALADPQFVKQFRQVPVPVPAGGAHI